LLDRIGIHSRTTEGCIEQKIAKHAILLWELHITRQATTLFLERAVDSKSESKEIMQNRTAIILAALFLCSCAPSARSIFDKPASAVVNTQWVVMNKGLPILAVFHTAGDEEWIFFADVNPSVDVQVSVTLEDLLKLDESLKDLGDLPAGWKATRGRKGGAWVREKLK